MNLSNGGLIAFHYRAYGTFFYNKIGSIISIGDLPTTNIIELLFFNPLQLTKSQKSNGKSVAFFGDKRLLSQTQILAFLQPTIVDNEP